MCHLRDCTSELCGNWLCPEEGNRPQPHFRFGVPRHYLASASWGRGRESEKTEESSSSGWWGTAAGHAFRAYGGKPPAAFPKIKHPSASEVWDPHCAPDLTDPPGHPRLTAIPPVENATLLAKRLFEEPAEQPGSLPQQTPPQAPWLPCFILNVPVARGHCYPSGPCVLLTPLTATSETEALQGHFCPLCGIILWWKKSTLPSLAGCWENWEQF